jgi:hypothetical protein
VKVVLWCVQLLCGCRAVLQRYSCLMPQPYQYSPRPHSAMLCTPRVAHTLPPLRMGHINITLHCLKPQSNQPQPAPFINLSP